MSIPALASRAAQTRPRSPELAPVTPPPAEPAPRPAQGDTFCRSGMPVAPPRTIPAGAPNERALLVEDMTRALPPGSRLRAQIADATSSFSTAQLRRMHDGGVSFADERGVPCQRHLPGTETGQGMRTNGRYLPASRTIQLRERANSFEITHEMAHAWDDVRNDRLRFRESAPERARVDQMRVLHNQRVRGDVETSGRPLPSGLGQYAAGFHSDTDRGIRTAYEDYRRHTSSSYAFDSARSGESRDNPREFYAAGYAAFHRDGGSREILRRSSPALYAILHREARAAGTLPSDAPAP